MGLAFVSLGIGSAEAKIVEAQIVVAEGDMPLGATLPVASTRHPFVLVDGSVAFVGLLDDGDTYVFIDDQVVWQGSAEMMSVLSGTETTMGAAVGGLFVYSPTVDGDDAIWTHNGLLTIEGIQAPAQAMGTTTTFHSRPLMSPSGAPYWIAGLNFSGGTSSEGRVLYRSPTGLPADIEVVLSTGDMVGGLVVDSPSGIDFDYDLSADESHQINVLLMDTGSTANDGHIVVDGALLHQENTPNGAGDNWDNFDLVTINNQGLYVMSGDTNGSTATDEFVAVDGSIAVREGDTLAGIQLGTSAIVRMISVNESARIAHAWSHDGGSAETVFYACDETDVGGSSLAVFTTGVDEFDFDGDGVADALITDYEVNNAASTESLTDDNVLYVEVEIDDGMGPREAMVRVPVTCCGNMVLDDGEECDDGNADDTDACSNGCQIQMGNGFPNNAYCDQVAGWNPAWTAFELEVLSLVNDARSTPTDCDSEGMFGATAPLAYNGSLTCAARNHSRDMGINDYFAHTNLMGEGPAVRIGYAEYSWSTWGENIAGAQTTPAAVVNGWLMSDGHCANIMNPAFSELGVGYFNQPGSMWTHYWTQNFGAPL